MSRRTSTPPEPLMNLGPTTRARLAAVGVPDAASLRRIGAAEAYRRLKAHLPNRVSLNALYALHAALDGVHWNTYPEDVKAQMRAEVHPWIGSACARRASR